MQRLHFLLYYWDVQSILRFDGEARYGRWLEHADARRRLDLGAPLDVPVRRGLEDLVEDALEAHLLVLVDLVP